MSVGALIAEGILQHTGAPRRRYLLLLFGGPRRDGRIAHSIRRSRLRKRRGTGIILQNRGAFFALDKKHPDHLQPGKRTFHTLIPGLLGRDVAGPCKMVKDWNDNMGQALAICVDCEQGLLEGGADPVAMVLSWGHEIRPPSNRSRLRNLEHRTVLF